MISRQHAGDLFVESDKFVMVYDESTLNSVFIECFQVSLWQILQNVWDTGYQPDFLDISFQAESFLEIR